MQGFGNLGLNDACIDRLQNYYGIAIRSNVGDLPKMMKAIYAALMHVAPNKENNYHLAQCPPGGDSWCSYQKDVANKTTTGVCGDGLPSKMIKHAKPIFEVLANDELLSRLHGLTKNQNESFNGTIWNRTKAPLCETEHI